MSGRLRITGGTWVRRLIDVPAAADRGLLRPTSDRVREALFSSLGPLEGDVLDVFAGSGALGFEALSRGASTLTSIERDGASMATLRNNAAALGVQERLTTITRDALHALAPLGQFSAVFADPPYATAMEGALAEALAARVAQGGMLVLERHKGSVPSTTLAKQLGEPTVRRTGDTVMYIYRRRSDDSTTMEMTMTTRGKPSAAIYPGSFDPMTNGHVDIIQRGLQMFDRLIVAVANNPQKTHVFSIEERLALVQQSLGHLPGLEIAAFDGLVVEFARKQSVPVLLRGLRAVSDFEYEFQLAGMNRRLAPEVETAFIVTSEDSFYVASRLVREVATFGGDVSSMVPPPVLAALHQKLKKR
jgi:pantetheine-phosphate adenylyltransferase